METNKITTQTNTHTKKKNPSKVWCPDQPGIMKIHLIFLVPFPPPPPLWKNKQKWQQKQNKSKTETNKFFFYLIDLSHFVVFEYNLRGGCYEDWSFFVRPEKEKGISHFLILTPSGRSQQDKT